MFWQEGEPKSITYEMLNLIDRQIRNDKEWTIYKYNNIPKRLRRFENPK